MSGQAAYEKERTRSKEFIAIEQNRVSTYIIPAESVSLPDVIQMLTGEILPLITEKA